MSKTVIDKATLCVQDKGITYNLCTLFQYINGDDISFRYVPNYSVIDIVPQGLFEGIQGIDLDLKKEEYIREGIPTFVSERIPPQNRENINKYIKKSGLDYYNPIALLKSVQGYNGDNIFVLEYKEPILVDVLYDGSYSSIKEVLMNIAFNNEVKINGKEIDSKTMFYSLFPIYIDMYDQKVLNQQKGVEVRKNNSSYKGRKAYQYDEKQLKQLKDLYESNQITIEKITSITGWSKSTFYRKIKNLSQN